jgi:hypothetical protein
MKMRNNFGNLRHRKNNKIFLIVNLFNNNLNNLQVIQFMVKVEKIQMYKKVIILKIFL